MVHYYYYRLFSTLLQGVQHFITGCSALYYRLLSNLLQAVQHFITGCSELYYRLFSILLQAVQHFEIMWARRQSLPMLHRSERGYGGTGSRYLCCIAQRGGIGVGAVIANVASLREGV